VKRGAASVRVVSSRADPRSALLRSRPPPRPLVCIDARVTSKRRSLRTVDSQLLISSMTCEARTADLCGPARVVSPRARIPALLPPIPSAGLCKPWSRGCSSRHRRRGVNERRPLRSGNPRLLVSSSMTCSTPSVDLCKTWSRVCSRRFIARGSPLCSAPALHRGCSSHRRPNRRRARNSANRGAASVT
jgi:hypothetical protein